MYIKIPKASISRMEIIKTDCKMTLRQLITKYQCDYAINGGLYDMKTGKLNPIPLRINGETVARSSNGYWMMAWNTGPDICMIHSKDMEKWKYAVACSTFLKDGQNTAFLYTAAQGGIRGRTGFGDDDDYVHMMVTTDKSGALSPISLRSKMKSNGCKNAIMLDCGGSSQMYADGKYIQGENREVAYWICVWMKHTSGGKTTTKCPFSEPVSTVKFGSSGESVKWVQWHLRSSVAQELPIDGTFYTKTKSAVISFQRKYGLDDDGVVGPATRAMMKQVVS